MEKIKVTVSLQEKKGIFQAVLQYKDVNGKKQYKWQTTGVKIVKGHKKELREKAKEIAENIRFKFENELNKNIGNYDFEDRKNMLFSDYMKEWLDSISNTKAETTMGGYESNVLSIICPYFEKKKISLKDLKTIDLQDFYDYQYSLNKKARTVKHYHNNIHKALEKARKTKLIDTNPSDDCELEKPTQFIPTVYSAKEMDVFLEKLKGTALETPTLITSFLGLRRSEVIGIKWNRINFEENTITIAHTVTVTTKNKKRLVIKKDLTKNDTSYRTLVMPLQLKEYLQELKNIQKENKKLFGSSYQNKENYVCVDMEGKLILPDSFTKSFAKFLEDNNLNKIRVHDLRHTIGSLLITNGATLREVQEFLGHSNIQTTEIYTHLDSSTKVHSANIINNLFSLVH